MPRPSDPKGMPPGQTTCQTCDRMLPIDDMAHAFRDVDDCFLCAEAFGFPRSFNTEVKRGLEHTQPVFVKDLLGGPGTPYH